MSKVKTTFSRKPTVFGIRIAGTLSSEVGGELTEAQAQQVLDTVVDALDNRTFVSETEELIVTLG